VIHGFALEYDNDIENGQDDRPLIAHLSQEYEWLNGTHRPEEPAQWLVCRVDLAKRDAHMAVAV
jgi:hypothetical protein